MEGLPPPTLAQSSPNVMSVSRTSNASLDCGILSDPPAKVIIAITNIIIINAFLDQNHPPISCC